MTSAIVQVSHVDFFMSESIGSITEALIEFQKACPVIPKECKGNRGKYADLPSILDIIKPILARLELNIQQFPSGRFGLVTILSHKSGEYMGARYEMEPNPEMIDKAANEKGITPQRIGSVITYQRRYAIGAILNLNIDVDDDSDLPAQPEPKKPTAKELIAQNQAAKNGTSAEVKTESATAPAAGGTTTKLMNEGGGATKESDSQPCSDALAQKIKNAVAAWEQQKPGASKQFKERLLASGRSKITDLNTGDATNLLRAIEQREIESFFDNQLKNQSSQTAA